MDRLFLDANVLFSAAYREDAGVARVWEVEGATPVTSSYAVLEARRNLTDEEQLARLGQLLGGVEVGEASMLHPDLRANVSLPEKDWPILGGAAASGATHLITGDTRDFGRYLEKRPLGVLVMTPAQYLKPHT
jgi:predicted nucleic acid-binding protein